MDDHGAELVENPGLGVLISHGTWEEEFLALIFALFRAFTNPKTQNFICDDWGENVTGRRIWEDRDKRISTAPVARIRTERESSE